MICADCDRQITGYAYRRAPNMLTICESCAEKSDSQILESHLRYLTLAEYEAAADSNDWNRMIDHTLKSHRERLFGLE